MCDLIISVKWWLEYLYVCYEWIEKKPFIVNVYEDANKEIKIICNLSMLL